MLEFMRKEGRTEWIGGGWKEAGECWVWWRTPEEWAAGIYEWVSLACKDGVRGELTRGRLMRRRRRILC